MRRTDLLVDHIRRATENVNPSTTDGIGTLEIIQYLNEGQDMIYSKIIQEFPNLFLKEGFISLVADQRDYALPSDIYLDTKIKTIEYKYGSGSTEYYKILKRPLHVRRTDFTSEVPYFYSRGIDNKISISPIPEIANTNGLRLIYQKKIRTLDARRGVITSAAKTSTTLNTITLDLTPSLGKDDDSVQAAADLLNILDYICVVDKDGDSVVDEIPVDSYDSTTGIITVTSGFTTSVAAGSFANQYIVKGKLATTESELPDICERYIVSYSVFKLLRRNANEIELREQKIELYDIQKDIVRAFKNPDDDIDIIPLDDIWRYGDGFEF